MDARGRARGGVSECGLVCLGRGGAGTRTRAARAGALGTIVEEVGLHALREVFRPEEAFKELGPRSLMAQKFVDAKGHRAACLAFALRAPIDQELGCILHVAASRFQRGARLLQREAHVHEWPHTFDREIGTHLLAFSRRSELRSSPKSAGEWKNPSPAFRNV